MTGISKTKFISRYLPMFISVLLLVGAMAVYLVVRDDTKNTEAAWYSSSWTYRKPITIDKNRLSTTATTTFSNFPLLFSVTDSDLKYTSFGGNMASSTGGDLLFTDSTGTSKLDFELEKYSSTTGETIAWVRIPLLSSASDTTIYIYFGNASASNQQNGAGVWESKYKGVWHLPDGSNLTANDSTANAFNGSVNSAVSAAGQFGGAAGFSGGSNIEINDSFYDSGTHPTITFSLWAKANSTATDHAMMLSRNFSPFVVQMTAKNGSNNFDYKTTVWAGGFYQPPTSGGALTSGAWHYIVGRYDGSAMKNFLDGTEQASVSGSGNLTTGSADIFVGAENNSSPAHPFDGSIDEMRIYDGVLSDDWIKTEYRNQSSPSTFYSYGAVGLSSRANDVPAEKARGGVKVRGGVKFR